MATRVTKYPWAKEYSKDAGFIPVTYSPKERE